MSTDLSHRQRWWLVLSLLTVIAIVTVAIGYGLIGRKLADQAELSDGGGR